MGSMLPYIPWILFLILWVISFESGTKNSCWYVTYGYGSIPIDTFLVGWTSIYQLFWGSLGTRVLTHPHMSSSCHHPFQKRCDGTRGTSGVQLLPATGVDFIIKGMEAVGTSWANEVTKLDKKSMILTYLGFIWLYVIQDLGFIWLYMALYGFIWY